MYVRSLAIRLEYAIHLILRRQREELLLPVGQTGRFYFLTAVITRRELTIRGSRTGISSEFEEVMNMVSNGQINIRQIISKKVKFEEIPQAVRELDEHPERDLKVIGLNL